LLGTVRATMGVTVLGGSVSLALFSCGTPHTALRYTEDMEPGPVHYGAVATSKAMASSRGLPRDIGCIDGGCVLNAGPTKEGGHADRLECFDIVGRLGWRRDVDDAFHSSLEERERRMPFIALRSGATKGHLVDCYSSYERHAHISWRRRKN
jgi:hypothetical protein